VPGKVKTSEITKVERETKAEKITETQIKLENRTSRLHRLPCVTDDYKPI